MSSSTEIGWVKKKLLKLKAFITSKNVLSFMVFLMLSTAFWFVHTLDRTRENKITLKLNYTGIPEDVKIQNQLTKEITVTIQDEGTKLLQYSRTKSIPLNIDLTRVYFSKGKIIIPPDQLKSKIQDYFLPTTAVLKIQPDSLVIIYQKLDTKDLPIKIGGDLQLKKQYILSDSIQIEPSKVKVFGPKNILDTMKAVYTEDLKLNDLADTVQLQSKLRTIKGINYSFNEVNISIFVEMFTENRIVVPITVINSPENLLIHLFPTSVNATYSVGLSNYKKVNPNDIKVVFDYNDVVNSQKRKNKLRTVNNSPYIFNLRIDPDEVEFLLEKNKG